MKLIARSNLDHLPDRLSLDTEFSALSGAVSAT